MVTQETKIMSVLNPYSDECENLVCVFDLHLNSKRKLDSVNIASIVSESGVELMNFLDEDGIPKVSSRIFLENGRGE